MQNKSRLVVVLAAALAVMAGVGGWLAWQMRSIDENNTEEHAPQVGPRAIYGGEDESGRSLAYEGIGTSIYAGVGETTERLACGRESEGCGKGVTA